MVCDVPVLLFCLSLRELVSLLKSLRTGWGPPLELVMRRLNSKFWVMEADLWADLLKICRWANPTTINKQDVLCAICKDVLRNPQITTCGDTFCAECIHSHLENGETQCPECQEPLKSELIPNKLVERFIKLYYEEKLSKYRPVVGQKRKREDAGECSAAKKQKSSSRDSSLCCGQEDSQPTHSQSTLTLKTLHPVLLPAKSTWFNLGIALGVDYDTLRSIKEDHKDCGDCLRETIQCRLTMSPPLTTDEIVTVLKSPTVSRFYLVEQLQ